MTSDELINSAFGSDKIYPPEKLYDFTKDKPLMEYLRNNYPEAYDFINLKELTIENSPAGIAAIGVYPSLTLYLNYQKLTYMREQCLPLNLTDFYKTLACLIIHEELHYVLKHFRVPFFGYNHDLLNIAQDMVIDNMINQKNPGWRNWEKAAEKINKAIDTQHSILKKISLDEKDKNYLLNLSDLDVYTYLKILLPDIKPPQSFDDHLWNKNNQRQQSGDSQQGNQQGSQQGSQQGDQQGNQQDSQQGSQQGNQQGNQQSSQQGNQQSSQQSNQQGNQQGSQQGNQQANQQGNNTQGNIPSSNDTGTAEEDNYSNIFSVLSNQARTRAAQNRKRPLARPSGGAGAIDRVIEAVAKGREHNLFNLLKKFIKKISYKQQTNTWKKISKKQPGLKPGVINKKAPGEVLILIDTSGSMHSFLTDYLEDTMYGIYSAFSKIAKVYGVPSRMVMADIADRVLTCKEIKDPKELSKIQLSLGGDTYFQDAFEQLVLNWKNLKTDGNTKSGKKNSSQDFPDFILVLTDFDDPCDFLADLRYKPLANRIIWLSTEPDCPFLPPIGHIVDVFAKDWYTSLR